MGTSTAVVTKPLAQLLGGVARYGTSGFSDSVTMRNALASINAMRQTVPEAWQYFKHRLNSYWSGDISTIEAGMLNIQLLTLTGRYLVNGQKQKALLVTNFGIVLQIWLLVLIIAIC